MSKVLVTGSEGTLGKPLCAQLGEWGHEVWRVDLAHSHYPRHIRADIGVYGQISKAISRADPDVVFNLAAEFGRHNGEEYSPQLWRTNAVGLKNILRIQEGERFKLIHASSSEVYGEGPWDVDVIDEGVTDRCPIKHHNDYAMSKWVNEGQVRNHVRSTGKKVVVPRFFNAYGPGEHYNPYRSVVCLFIYRALTGQPITVYKDYHRVFMYINDFIPTLARCMSLEEGVVNIGGSDYRSVEELLGIIRCQLGSEFISKVTVLGKDAHNTVDKCPNIDKARSLLNHNPQVGLEEGVERTIAWMRGEYGLL